ncbi:hypothetical protein BBJ28_00000633 [Nothophytophthora sp. Chile5]|nr:hypothetical protein BBJ28_00000633 [Nothophytophthora sp. Chile5]
MRNPWRIISPVTVREDRAKLVINREVIVLGTYLDFEPNASPYHDPMADVSEMDLLLLKDNPMDGITTDFDDDELFNDLTPTSISTSEASRQAFELAEISDFSPDWDFGDGGAKILICLASRLPEELAQDPVKLFVQFGGRRESIQLSHKKPFTYRMDERQCKIRVVERLSEFHQAIRTKAAEPTPNPASPLAVDCGRDPGITAEFSTDNMPSLPTAESSSSSWTDQVQQHGDLGQDCQSEGATESASTLLSSSGTSIALDDCTIETLSDKDLEQLSEKLLERVVRQLITVAHTSEELLEELNSLDETGLSLLHYVSFYNYAQLVPVLVAHGAHINQQSTQGQTALHLAAGCGHDEVVAVLLQSGADLLVLDFDGLTAADRAEKSGHAEVSGTLRRHMGVEVSASVSCAVDETAGFGGSPMEIDDVPTPYRDAGDMGLLEGGEYADIQAGENQEHNRKLLLGAFSTMSLHDKCALSLSISRDSVGHNARRRESSVGEEGMGSPGGSSSTTSVGLGSSPASMVGLDSTLVATRLLLAGGEHDSDVKSVIAEDEESLTKLQAAMELMGPEERQSLEDEVTVLQHNIRAWLLKRNCKNMRETTKKLREATQSMEDQQKQQEAGERHAMLTNEISQRERAAVTVQAATRTMLARRSFLQTKHVAIKVQAATRGVLCRKNFARMKAHALASLVIQRNVREWWHKQPAATRPTEDDEGDEEDEEKAEAPMAMEGALREPHEGEGLHTMHSM